MTKLWRVRLFVAAAVSFSLWSAPSRATAPETCGASRQPTIRFDKDNYPFDPNAHAGPSSLYIPPYSQGDTMACWAAVTAQMSDFRRLSNYRTWDRSPSVDDLAHRTSPMALYYRNCAQCMPTGSTAAVPAPACPSGVRTDLSNVEYGFQLMNRTGQCHHEAIWATGTNASTWDTEQLEAALRTNFTDVLYGSSKADAAQVFCARITAARWGFSQAQVNSLMTAFNDSMSLIQPVPNANNDDELKPHVCKAVDNFYTKICEERRYRPFEGNWGPSAVELAGRSQMDATLTEGKPVAVMFPLSRINSLAQPGDDHQVLVIGRKRASNGQCLYLIRNSEGVNTCTSIREPLKARCLADPEVRGSGNFWMTEAELFNGAGQLSAWKLNF